MSDPAMTVEKLRALSDAEIISLHDKNAVGTIVGVQYFLDELARRDASRVNESMLRLTRVITVLTIVVTVATIVQLGLAIWG